MKKCNKEMRKTFGFFFFSVRHVYVRHVELWMKSYIQSWLINVFLFVFPTMKHVTHGCGRGLLPIAPPFSPKLFYLTWFLNTPCSFSDMPLTLRMTMGLVGNDLCPVGPVGFGLCNLELGMSNIHESKLCLSTLI